MSALEDSDLALLCAAGDRCAWEELYRRHRFYVLGAIRQATATLAKHGRRLACETADILQEMALAIPRFLRGYRPGGGRLRAYLAAAVRHAVYNLAETTAVGGPVEFAREEFSPAMYRHWLWEQHIPTPEQIVSAKEQLEHVSIVASKLTPALRRTWFARAVEGLSCEETAKRHGTTPRYVTTATVRAWRAFHSIERSAA